MKRGIRILRKPNPKPEDEHQQKSSTPSTPVTPRVKRGSCCGGRK